MSDMTFISGPTKRLRRAFTVRAHAKSCATWSSLLSFAHLASSSSPCHLVTPYRPLLSQDLPSLADDRTPAFPVEIWDQILSLLDTRSQSSCGLACHYLRERTLRPLFSTIVVTLPVTMRDVRLEIDDFISLVRRSPRVANHIQHLVIRSCNYHSPGLSVDALEEFLLHLPALRTLTIQCNLRPATELASHAVRATAPKVRKTKLIGLEIDLHAASNLYLTPALFVDLLLLFSAVEVLQFTMHPEIGSRIPSTVAQMKPLENSTRASAPSGCVVSGSVQMEDTPLWAPMRPFVSPVLVEAARFLAPGSRLCSLVLGLTSYDETSALTSLNKVIEAYSPHLGQFKLFWRHKPNRWTAHRDFPPMWHLLNFSSCTFLESFEFDYGGLWESPAPGLFSEVLAIAPSCVRNIKITLTESFQLLHEEVDNIVHRAVDWHALKHVLKRIDGLLAFEFYWGITWDGSDHCYSVARRQKQDEIRKAVEKELDMPGILTVTVVETLPCF
ncbi:hypothetical protein EIP91_003931 [Steccherinum ochraceum]|uniref:F-box domain-containing protein n=1 Tax=Steccherinum ochraceum TaxID=92696 RepID=A0A4R0RSV7_9APHY|nr:hypothetical protein EIP91_003931 [Steccherinum ochraceum]